MQYTCVEPTVSGCVSRGRGGLKGDSSTTYTQGRCRRCFFRRPPTFIARSESIENVIALKSIPIAVENRRGVGAHALDQQNGGGARVRGPLRARGVSGQLTTMWVETWVEEIPRLCVGAVRVLARALGARHPGSDASGPAIQATMRGSRSGAGSDRRTIRSRLMYGPCRVACTVLVYVSDTTTQIISIRLFYTSHTQIKNHTRHHMF